MKKTLQGLRVLNTRPKKQAQRLTQEILAVGGSAIECPALEIIPAYDHWIDTLPHLDQVQHAIFISANAVHCCFDALGKRQIHWPTHINNIAIGRASAEALKEHQIQAHELPKKSDSEHLLELESLKHIKHQSLLLFKGEGGRTHLEEHLIKRGAHLSILTVYRRELPKVSQKLIDSIWQDDLVDIILFTSELSMHNLFKLFGKSAYGWLINKPAIVLSERIANSASLIGLQNIITCHPEQIMDTLFDYYQGSFHDK